MTYKQLSKKVCTEFVGWIDERDLAKIKFKQGRFSFPNRYLIIYDKHWYDNRCFKVIVKVLKEKK